MKPFVACVSSALVSSVAIAALAGCGGSSAAVGVAPPIQQGSQLATALTRRATIRHSMLDRVSWASPAAKSRDLLYISDLENQDVAFYSWPDLKPMGDITGFFNPEGLCVNKAGDVWVTNDTSLGVHQVTEYAHGATTPMNNLVDPDGSTLGCSVNFRNNELAVTNFFGPHGQGSVEFWKNSTGTPTSIIAPNIYYYWYCGYDDKGNLYTDGFSSGSSMSLAVRRRGRNKFETINIDVNPFWYPGGVQWDGKYLAVGDEYGPIYRYAIVGNKATEIDTVTLNDENEVPQFWIHGTTVIAPNSNGHNTEIYAYPAGGDPTATIAGNDPTGSTISPARR